MRIFTLGAVIPIGVRRLAAALPPPELAPARPYSPTAPRHSERSEELALSLFVILSEAKDLSVGELQALALRHPPFGVQQLAPARPYFPTAPRHSERRRSKDLS